ncbi:MAG TPA: hypothetical protein PLD86_19305, partial [Vicinamibacteria bacterium]|nr:hypothetical protein [Vicinamibacteria bacterium]
YQLLAAFVTYAAIVTTYIPPIYAELSKSPEASAPAPSEASGGAGATNPLPPESPSTVPAAGGSGGPVEPISVLGALGALVLAGAFLYAIAFAAPFLMGVENLIGILIIGFAVHQAWRMNARRVFDVKGPFRVAAKSIPDPATPAASDIAP